MDVQAQRRAERIETLLQEIGNLPDPRARAHVEELIGALLELYGDGLARILDLTAEAESAGDELIATFAGDELVGSLLLLHGMHPDDVEARVARALEGVRPYLASHGGNVELLGVSEGTANLRLQGSCSGCPSSTVTLKLAIEEAIYAAAPDLVGLHVEGVVEPPPHLITLTPGRRTPNGKTGKTASAASGTPDSARPAQPAGAWCTVEGVLPLAPGTLLAATVEEEALLFCQVADTHYAYRNRCAGCGARLDDGALEGTLLRCASCDRRYDVARAGRDVEHADVYIEPLPLLVEAGTLKVALPAPVGAG